MWIMFGNQNGQTSKNMWVHCRELFKCRCSEGCIHLEHAVAEDGFLVSFHMEDRWYTQLLSLIVSEEVKTYLPGGGHSEFTQLGRQRSTTTCLRWFLKLSCPYLSTKPGFKLLGTKCTIHLNSPSAIEHAVAEMLIFAVGTLLLWLARR